MEKRYQVFVSSTYQDLQAERQEVMHALLELDCIPSGMELFPAANESQWSLIKKVIDDCDYYVLIMAGRYGTCDENGMGYTEKEYRYALSVEKPVLAFLHSDPGTIQANKCEASEEAKQRLNDFRSLVEKRLCKYWSTPVELGSVVSRSLVHLIKTSPAIGWVRGDELPYKDATLELLKLRQRVDDLQSELARARRKPPEGSEELAQGEDRHQMNFTYEVRAERSYTWVRHSGSFETSWHKILSVVSPLMINEASERSIRVALDNYVSDTNAAELGAREEFKGRELRNIELSDEDFHTVKVQLRALGLIAKSERPRSVKDVQTYWTLTPLGDETMTRLRAIRRAEAGTNPDR